MKISLLTPVAVLDGTESSPCTQAGTTLRTSLQSIANLSGAPAATVEFTSDANLTLTQAQYQAESIEFTDSPTTLTAGRDVVFPAHFPTKWVKNSTARTLTLKKSGQTGVAVAAGATAIVASGASDVVVGPGAGAMSNPMTTSQDIIVGGSSGTPGRLGVGANGQALVVSGGVLAYAGGEGISEPVTGLTSSSGAVTVNCALGDYFTFPLTENVTSWSFTNLPASGKAQTIMVRIQQHASAAKTVAWPSSFKWAGGAASAVSTTLSAYDVLAITTFDQGTRWEVTMAKGFA
jgi:hypothetical protein